MHAAELVPGPTAGLLDVWRRGLNLGSLVVFFAAAAVFAAFGVATPMAFTIAAAFAIPLFAFGIVVGRRGAVALRRESAAGYSTLYDIEGYELRDPRTLQLLRPADEKPTGLRRKSLLFSMLRPKPGTVLARRMADDD